MCSHLLKALYKHHLVFSHDVGTLLVGPGTAEHVLLVSVSGLAASVAANCDGSSCTCKPLMALAKPSPARTGVSWTSAAGSIHSEVL